VQEGHDVLGNRAVHGWGVVTTAQEQILPLAGLKRQYFRCKVQNLDAFLSRTFDRVRKPGVASDAAICRQSDSDALGPPASCETVQTNE
jgi:hypothetical protein